MQMPDKLFLEVKPKKQVFSFKFVLQRKNLKITLIFKENYNRGAWVA